VADRLSGMWGGGGHHSGGEVGAGGVWRWGVVDQEGGTAGPADRAGAAILARFRFFALLGVGKNGRSCSRKCPRLRGGGVRGDGPSGRGGIDCRGFLGRAIRRSGGDPFTLLALAIPHCEMSWGRESVGRMMLRLSSPLPSVARNKRQTPGRRNRDAWVRQIGGNENQPNPLSTSIALPTMRQGSGGAAKSRSSGQHRHVGGACTSGRRVSGFGTSVRLGRQFCCKTDQPPRGTRGPRAWTGGPATSKTARVAANLSDFVFKTDGGP